MSGRDSMWRRMGSRPLCAIIPFRDGARYAALSGDGKPGDLITEQSPGDVGRYCAALIAAVPASQRREAVRHLMARLSELRERVLPTVPIAPFLPEGATIEQDNKIINGLHLMLLALGSAPGDASVGSVTANAAAMAAGVPYASDPLVGERQNEVILAKSILEAALLGDDDAKKWFADHDLQDALKSMVTYSAAGGSDQLPIHQSAQARLFQIYDCMQHDLPLGGTPISGDFWQDIWGGIKTAAGKAILNTVGKTDSAPKSSSGQSVTSEHSETGSHEAGAETGTDTTAGAVSKAADLKLELSKARNALEDAKNAMEQGQENIASYRANLKDAALQSARLQWAQSLLDVPDDVATILSATTPNMSDVSTFLQSILSILPAAKETGSTSTLKSLLYAIRAATQSAGGDGSLYALLQGDPAAETVKDVIVNDAPGWMRVMTSARSEQADVAGAVVSEMLGEQRDNEGSEEPSEPVTDISSLAPQAERGATDTAVESAPEGVVENVSDDDRVGEEA